MSEIQESLRESRTALRDVFRNRNLRRLNLAFAGSVIGDWAYGVAASVYAYRQGGVAAVGVLEVVRFVSMAILAPFAALLADKFDRKRVMISADAVRVVLILAAAMLIEFGGPPLSVYVLAVVTSVVGTAFRPALAALMPSLANHPGELTAANVASSTIESIGFFIGPAIGGLLLAVADIATVYVFNAATFVWSALLVMGLRPVIAAASAGPADNDTPVTEESTDERPSLFAGVGDGFREIFANRDIRLLIGLAVAQTIVAGASVVFGVAIALDLLDLGNGGVGLLDSALGVGGLLGGFVALILAQRGSLARDFGLGIIMWAAPLFLIAAWPTLPSTLIAMAIIGIANSVVDVNAYTILQRLVPDEVMGRVFGAMESAVVGGMALGALMMPILISTIGLRSGLVVIGAGVTLVVILGIPGLQRIDKVALAPAGLDLIRGVAILGPLPDNVLERLARRSATVIVPSGQTVLREGEVGDQFFIIESGTVDVTIRGAFVRTLSVGDSFGEIALLRDIPRTATVTATTDLTARTIARDAFLAAVIGDGESSDQADLVVTRLLTIR